YIWDARGLALQDKGTHEHDLLKHDAFDRPCLCNGGHQRLETEQRKLPRLIASHQVIMSMEWICVINAWGKENDAIDVDVIVVGAKANHVALRADIVLMFLKKIERRVDRVRECNFPV